MSKGVGRIQQGILYAVDPGREPYLLANLTEALWWGLPGRNPECSRRGFYESVRRAAARLVTRGKLISGMVDPKTLKFARRSVNARQESTMLAFWSPDRTQERPKKRRRRRNT